MPVAATRSKPWGLIAGVVAVVLFAGAVFGYAAFQGNENEALKAAVAEYTPSAENQDPSDKIPGILKLDYPGALHVTPEERIAYPHSPPLGGGWRTATA